ncbi:hypothetical protein ACO0J1_13085 [Stenotrophomonas acidaminiphila]|uniref:hypothetical protein n=1 Tax=Stenotrophomonas acidaminiphila TaxID=128780 RepID=UPI003BF26ADF
MNTIFRCRKFLFAMLLGLLPLSVLASVEADRACEDDFCWSVTKRHSEQLKDYYVYVQPQAAKHLVVRYQSGAQINILIREAPARSCGSSFIEAKAASLRLARGQGCLVTTQGDKAVSFNYQISAANVSQFMHMTAPVIWLSGFSREGDFLPAASTLLALEGR